MVRGGELQGRRSHTTTTAPRRDMAVPISIQFRTHYAYRKEGIETTNYLSLLSTRRDANAELSSLTGLV